MNGETAKRRNGIMAKSRGQGAGSILNGSPPMEGLGVGYFELKVLITYPY